MNIEKKPIIISSIFIYKIDLFVHIKRQAYSIVIFLSNNLIR